MKNRLSASNFQMFWGADLDDLDKMVIKSPVLSERQDDIPILLEQLLARANREEGRDIQGFSPEAMHSFMNYEWKKEGSRLQHALYKAMESCQGLVVELDDIPPYFRA